jgi:hypothetical protein
MLQAILDDILDEVVEEVIEEVDRVEHLFDFELKTLYFCITQRVGKDSYLPVAWAREIGVELYDRKTNRNCWFSSL